MAKDLTVGKPANLIFAYSMPLLIGNVFQQLYSMVDTIIVGKYIGEDALAAVGSTGALNFLVLGFVFGLTGGFAVLTAQKYGAKDEDGVRKAVATSILLCFVTTVILTIISVSTTRPLLELMNTPDNIIKDAYRYIIIIYYGIGAAMLYNISACILRAIGDSKTPLYFLVLSSILNILLDLFLIIVFNMGVAGAAVATVISQGISGVLCLIYMIVKYPMLRLKKSDFALDFKLMNRHWYLGLPMAFQFSVTAIGVIILQGALNLFGSTKIAAYSAANKIEQLVTQPAGTFGVTMANYTGQNLGAGKIDRIREGVKQSSIITILFAILGAIIVVIFGKPLTSLFVKENSAQIFEASKTYLNTVAVFFPVLNIIFIYRNALQGIGKSFMPFMAGVFELIARTIAAFTLPTILGYKGICLAGPVAWFAAAIPLGITYFLVMPKLLKHYQNS